MQIPCVSCQSRFRLDSRLVKATGSLVRCTKCGYIFLVCPSSIEDEPVVQDTNIAQSVLFDLFNVEQTAKDKGLLPDASKIFNSHEFDEIASIKDFEEEEDDQDPEIEDIDLDELPDLSEYEDMIEWDEPPDSEIPTDGERKFYNGTQDLDIDECR